MILSRVLRSALHAPRAPLASVALVQRPAPAPKAYHATPVSLRDVDPSNANSDFNRMISVDREKKKTVTMEAVSPYEQAPNWNERLASESEATIKAERSPNGELDVKTLQSKTVEHVHKVSGEDDLDHHEAHGYSREATDSEAMVKGSKHGDEDFTTLQQKTAQGHSSDRSDGRHH